MLFARIIAFLPFTFHFSPFILPNDSVIFVYIGGAFGNDYLACFGSGLDNRTLAVT